MKDILGTGTATLFLISEKFCSLLKDADLTGWQTFEVKVLDKKGIEVPGYYGLSITVPSRCNLNKLIYWNIKRCSIYNTINSE